MKPTLVFARVVTVAVAAGACIPDLDGAPCPCAPGWCCSESNVCIRGGSEDRTTCDETDAALRVDATSVSSISRSDSSSMDVKSVLDSGSAGDSVAELSDADSSIDMQALHADAGQGEAESSKCSCGIAWTTTNRVSPDRAFLSVHGSDLSDVWAVGEQGAAAHWDGQGWGTYASGADQDLKAVWVSGRNRAWAVGNRGTTLRWDGSSWSQVPSRTSASLLAVRSVKNGEVWAVGESGTMLRWTADTGEPLDDKCSSPSYLDLVAILTDIDAPQDTWIIGASKAGDRAVAIQAADGGCVVYEPASPRVCPTADFKSVVGAWGRTHDNALDVWTIVHCSEAAGLPVVGGELIHWNGTTGSSANVSYASKLRAFWGAEWNDLWAVGQEGTIAHYDGVGWNECSCALQERSQDLRAVWSADGRVLWAVGDQGIARLAR